MFTVLESNSKYNKDIMQVIMQVYGIKNINNIPHNAYLSGSSVLKIIQQKSPRNFNDLDIYIQNGLSEYECNNFMTELFNAGYLYRTSLAKKQNIKKALMNVSDNKEYEVDKNHIYFSLKEYIDKIVSLTNSGKQSIDIIIMNKTIEELLENTFDMDIVKNYVKIRDVKLNVKVMNIDAINQKKATITDKHFKERILHNAYEFNNFIKRYMKYSENYNIYIGNHFMSKDKFMNIVKYIFEDINNYTNKIVYKEPSEDKKNIIGKVKIEDTVYSIGSFNEHGVKVLFKHLIHMFNDKNRLNDLEKFIKKELIDDEYTQTACIIS